MKLSHLSFALLMLNCGYLGAQPAPDDPVGENLFPPELIVGHSQALGLSDAQRSALLQEIEKAHARFAEMHEKLQKEIESFRNALKKERVDESAALAQLDKVLNQEREIKRAHLALVLRLKNQLSAEQQAKLREIKKTQPQAEGPPPGLVEKMQKVQAGVRRWQEEGRDPTSVGELMQGFEPLMKQWKVKEAEELLDKALRMLAAEEKN